MNGHPESVTNFAIFFSLLSNILCFCLFLGVFEPFDSLVVVVSLLSCVQLFCDLMDCSPPGSSVHGNSQARMLEWVAISFSRGSSQLRFKLIHSNMIKSLEVCPSRVIHSSLEVYGLVGGRVIGKDVMQRK